MNNQRRWSITTRITLFAGTVAALLFVLMVVIVMTGAYRFATAERRDEVIAAGGRVAHQVEHHQLAAPLAEQKDRNVQVVDPAGVVVASTPQLKGKPPMADFDPDGRNMRTGVVCGGVFPSGECNIVVAQSAHREGQDWTVYSASPAVPRYVTPWLAGTVVGGAALMALAITGLGHRIVTTSLKPVTAIRAELDRISETGADRRVPLPPSLDEIHDLAGSVNRTLARLQAAMRQQCHFTSDASHELRTPIAAIRAEVEDALYAPEDTSVPTLGNAVLSSVDRLEAIVDDLLTIARLEVNRPAGGEPIALAEFVTAEREKRQNSAKRFEYALEPGVVVNGDRTLLSRLLTSLTDNAERHAASTVAVRLRRAPGPQWDAQRFPHGIALLEVIDDGPGIDPDKREVVFQRFARLDTARDRGTGGTGLGLAIARQIAEAYDGSLRIEDSPRGARFVLRLPLHPIPDDVPNENRGRT